MTRFHIIKDGTVQASTATREAAIDLIRAYQAKETHQWLKANFSIIKGEEEHVPYKQPPPVPTPPPLTTHSAPAREGETMWKSI